MATDHAGRGSATTAQVGAEPRHSAIPLADLTRRAVLVLAAAGAVLVGAPTLITAPLTLLATLAVVERVVRFRRRGLLDAVLCGVAAVIIGLALLGLQLNVLPWGLTRQSWAIGSGVPALLALACCLRRADPPSLVGIITRHSRSAARPGRAPYTMVYIGAGLLLIAGSLLLAGRSSSETQLTPVEMSAIVTTSDSTEITLRSDTAAGPFDIIVQSDAGTVVAATGVSIAPGVGTVIDVSPLPAGYVALQLTAAGGTDAIRELIFTDSIPAGEN